VSLLFFPVTTSVVISSVSIVSTVLASGCVFVDGPGRQGHDVVDGDGVETYPAFHAAPHVAIGQDPLQAVLSVRDEDKAQVSTVDFVDGFQRRRPAKTRGILSPVIIASFTLDMSRWPRVPPG